MARDFKAEYEKRKAKEDWRVMAELKKEEAEKLKAFLASKGLTFADWIRQQVDGLPD